MPRARQLKLPLPNTHGGRRKGAGRPNCSGLKAHVRRPRLTGREPLHVTIELRSDLPSLRRRDVLDCLMAAVETARGKGLAIIHFSILSNHAHFILEARDQRALARALRSLGVSFAKRVNSLLGRAGAVFHGRYHLHVLRTPSEVRNAIRYVVSNEIVHRARDGTKIDRMRLDGFSTASELTDLSWRKLFSGLRRTGSATPVLASSLEPPSTWLLRSGWARAG